MIRQFGTAPRPAPASSVLLPLAVFSDVGHCDAPREHEIRIVSDGRTAYAYGTEHRAVDCGPVARAGVTLTVTCNQPDRDDVPCDGRVVFSIDTEGTWTAEPSARRTLAAYGQPVES